MKEPSLRDVLSGIGTAILAAAVMLVAVLAPFLLLIVAFQQGAGLIAVGVLCASSVLVFRWMRTRRHRYAHRH